MKIKLLIMSMFMISMGLCLPIYSQEDDEGGDEVSEESYVENDDSYEESEESYTETQEEMGEDAAIQTEVIETTEVIESTQTVPSKTVQPVIVQPVKVVQPGKKTVSKPVKTTLEVQTVKVPPRKGMVWVNTETKVYYKEDNPSYGKTKKGEFMTEETAIKLGAKPFKKD